MSRREKPAELSPAPVGRHAADDVLVLGLAMGKEVAEAAQAAGVSESTAYRRLKEPSFRRQVMEVRSRMVDRAVGHLADGLAEASQALRKLLKSRTERVRLAAAKAMLDALPALREHGDLCEQVDELSKAVSGGGDERAISPQSEGLVAGGPRPEPAGAGDVGGAAV